MFHGVRSAETYKTLEIKFCLRKWESWKFLISEQARQLTDILFFPRNFDVEFSIWNQNAANNTVPTHSQPAKKLSINQPVGI